MYKSLKKQNYMRGFSLAELLIVFAILAILVSMAASFFSKLNGREALDTAITTAISVLNEAKSLSVSSKDASDYGVRILNNKLVSFKNSYGTDNKETTISSLVRISTSTGIGTDVIFSNVSGSVNASGTITITVLNDASETGTIRIYSTGLVEKN